MEEQVLVRVLVAERMKVLSFIQSMVRSPELAEDVFQDVCVLAIKKSDTLKGEAHLMNWLRTAARFNALKVLRNREERHLSLDDRVLSLLESEWERLDTEDSAARSEALRQCIDRLSPPSRDLLQKRFVDGIPYPHLAKSLSRSVKSLYVTFSRIYASVGDCVTHRLRTRTVQHG